MSKERDSCERDEGGRERTQGGVPCKSSAVNARLFEIMDVGDACRVFRD